MLDIAAAENIKFDNRFVRSLPRDTEAQNFRRQVPGACYSRVTPTPVEAPLLAAFSKEIAGELGFSDAFCESKYFTQVFSGNLLMKGMDPYAMCYGGHQFGNWAGQLGDGRAINLGEVLTASSGRQTLQLKGAGPTPYSRQADGLAVLRSSIREFLCSEAMFHIGIPTTRALSLILTGEKVERDMFYDGHPRLEPGAVVCRVSPSFIRFGNFEIHAARGETGILKQLADYTITMDFPHLGEPGPDTYIQWFREVCKATCDMIVHWMRVGFVHGVMNTDNMSILGLTIDYGPYGWLEDYNPTWTPNTTDAGMRRYCFGNQPKIALWNLVRLGNAIYPLINRAEPLQEILNEFETIYAERFNTMMAKKLGFNSFEKETDEKLIKDLLDLLSVVETDMTVFFRNLAQVDIAARNKDALQETCALQNWASSLMDAYYTPSQITPAYEKKIDDWLERYAARLESDDRDPKNRRQDMNQINPKYVLRNYLAQLAIEKAENNDFSMIHELMDVMRRPYDEQPGKEAFAGKRPDWAKTKPGCSMLSCSS